MFESQQKCLTFQSFYSFKNSHFFLRSKLAFRYGKVHIFQKTFFEGFFFQTQWMKSYFYRKKCSRVYWSYCDFNKTILEGILIAIKLLLTRTIRQSSVPRFISCKK